MLILRRPISKKFSFKSEILWTIAPLLIWLLAVSLRPHVIDARCQKNPDSCSYKSVFILDRVSLRTDFAKTYPDADRYSYYGQNTSSVLAFSIPILRDAMLIATGSPALGVLRMLVEDFLIIGQTVAWNGATTETSHLISQRPRPFVYWNPAASGANPSHYTSFYSGHTSFSAAAMVGLLLLLIGRKANRFLIRAIFLLCPALIFSTALLRVLAERHFITDVIAGAVAGISVAVWIAVRHRSGPELA